MSFTAQSLLFIAGFTGAYLLAVLIIAVLVWRAPVMDDEQ